MSGCTWAGETHRDLTVVTACRMLWPEGGNQMGRRASQSKKALDLVSERLGGSGREAKTPP